MVPKYPPFVSKLSFARIDKFERSGYYVGKRTFMIVDNACRGRRYMGKKRLSRRDFVAINNIGDYCMVSPSTVRRWIKDGKLHAYRLPSGQYRVPVQDLKDFFKRNDLPVPNDLK